MRLSALASAKARRLPSLATAQWDCVASLRLAGVAPIRSYIPELLVDVLAGRLDPSPVLDLIVDLAGVPEGYRAMDTRKAIKVMVKM